MRTFFAKRLSYLLLTMVAVSFAVFLIMEFTPGQAARKILGPYATQEQVDLLTEEMGLNRPALVRYLEWLGKIAHGDLGYSQLYRRPGAEGLGDRHHRADVDHPRGRRGRTRGLAARSHDLAREHHHDLDTRVRYRRLSREHIC